MYKILRHNILNLTLDSLLSIAKDTSQYLNVLQKIPIHALLESDVFTSIKIFAIRKQFDKVVEYADQSMKLGQDAENIFQFSGDLLPHDIKLKLSQNECSLHNDYQKKVPKVLNAQISDMALVDSKLRELGILKKVNYSAIRFNDSINFNN